MAIVIRMPVAAAGATEAALQSWLVSVGDTVVEGQPIAEIETEKAVFEHEAEAAGTVAQLLVEPGAGVAVGTPIAVLAQAGESAADAVTAAGVGGHGPSARPVDHPGDGRPSPVAAPGARLFASPLVRRLARERGLDLSLIPGTGPGGRIVRRDVELLAPPAPNVGESRGTGADQAESSEIGAGLRRPDAADGPVADAFTDVPHSPMRRAIARRLIESVTQTPQFTVSADARVDRLIALRQEANRGRAQAISLNDFIVKAVGGALIDVPEANAIWTEHAVRRFAHADIGVAVAIDGGLVTPVIRDVDRTPLGELSGLLHELVDRARTGRLRQSELEGGSFAVSNLGVFGTKEFSAIINPPHSGILAVGAAQRRAVVAADDALEAATVMTLTITADHRVVDGALAARLLGAIADRLEHPVGMLL